MQALVEAGRKDVCVAVRCFGNRITKAIVDTCTSCMADLDEQLYGIRNGVVADEAAVKRMKVRKCVPLTFLVHPCQSGPHFALI